MLSRLFSPALRAALVLALATASSIASASTCSEVFGGTLDSLSPQSVESRRNELIKIAPTYYQSAFQFASKYGYNFAHFVLSQTDPRKKTTLLIAMGGAEHLGTLLEAYIRKNKVTHVDVKYAYVTRKMTGHWAVQTEPSMFDSEGVKARHYLGYVEAPDPEYFRQTPHEKITLNDRNTPGTNTPDEVIAYLRDQVGAFENPKLVVIDTGFWGSIPHIIAELARKGGYKGELAGILLKKNERQAENLSLPVFGFNQALSQDSQTLRDIGEWAYTLDMGLSYTDISRIQGRGLNEELEFEKQSYAFRRSRPSPEQLVQKPEKKDGKFYPSTSEYTDPARRDQYAATLLGIEDGLAKAYNPHCLSVSPNRLLRGPSIYRARVNESSLWHVLNNQQIYLDAYNQGQPHAVMMVEQFGFWFGPERSKVRVPSVTQIVKAYEGRMSEAVSKGWISAQEVLKPVRIVRKGKGSQYLYIGHGDPIPEGYKATNDLLSTRTYLETLAQGYIPLSEPSFEIRGGRDKYFTITIHDLSHLTGLMEFPLLGRTFKRASRKLLANPTENANFFVENTPESYRVLFAVEYLERVRIKKKDVLPASLFDSSGDLRATELKEWLGQLSAKELQGLGQQVLDGYAEIVSSGGATRDIITGQENEEGGKELPEFVEASVSVFLYRLSYFLNRDRHLFARDEPSKGVRLQLARTLMALHDQDGIEPHVLVEELMSPKVDPHSHIHRIFCSGNSWADLNMVNAICGP